jgi:Astacin (Peptidase family M12A)
VGIKKIFLSGVIFFATAGGCEKRDEVNTETQGLAMIGAAWPQNKVTVCWATSDYPQTRLAIEKLVRAEFGRAKMMIGDGKWDACSRKTPSETVHLLFADLGTVTEADANAFGTSRVFGEGSLRRGEHYQIRFHKKLLQTNDKPTNEILGTALHEFGHIVGLLHEHERKDVSTECLRHLENPPSYEASSSDFARDSGYSVVRGTDLFDSKSVMNYCYLDEAKIKNETVHLSDGDIATIAIIRAAGRSKIKREMTDMIRLLKLVEKPCDRPPIARFIDMNSSGKKICVQPNEDIPKGDLLYNPITGSIR